MRSTPVRLVLFFLLAVLLYGCSNKKRDYMQGYIDAELAYMSSTRGGKLTVLDVDRGYEVKIGDVLFKLEEEPEKSALELGMRKVDESKARLKNAEKGQRPTELEALEAKITQAEARNDLAKVMYERELRLVEKKAAAQVAADQAKREVDESTALVDELRAELETAKLGARTDEIKAAKAQLQQAESDLERLQWEYDQKVVRSSVNASVFDRYYELGENVAAYKPVLSLLIPDRIRGIFYVAEKELNKVHLGQKVEVICDGCKKTTATVSFISPQAEYTPPVIYSKERRSELVFRVETKFDSEEMNTHLGLPIEVKLLE